MTVHRNSVLNQARFGESTSVLIKESPVTGSLDLGLKAFTVEEGGGRETKNSSLKAFLKLPGEGKRKLIT